MSKLIYSMSVSLDGYIVGPDGKFEWAMPDEQLHRYHNQQARELAGHLLGRRLYESMLYWETAHQEPDADEVTLEFATVWRALPKVVFSRTLGSVEGSNTSLACRDLASELAMLRQSVQGDIGVGGAGLAAEAIRLDLVDEYHLFVYPIAVGGGIPFFPSDQALELELLETHTFSSRVVYLKYRPRNRPAG